MKHSKRLNRLSTAGAALIAASLMLVGCSSGTGGGSSSTPSATKLNIGLFIPATQNAYQQAELEGVKAAAKHYGAKVTVLDANFDAQTQNNQMDLALQRKSFNAWVLIAYSGTQQCSEFQKAAATGVPIMLATDDICDGDHKGAVGFVGVQSKPTFAKWWDYILSKNSPQDMAVITGQPLQALTDWTESTLKDAQKAHPGFTVVANENSDYSTQAAYQWAQDVLHAHPNLRLIASNYAGMTQGIVEAVKAAGLEGKVKVYDLLANEYIIGQIKDGTVTATLPGLPRSEGYYSVEALVNHAKGKKVPAYYNPLDGLKISGGPFVTSSNVSEFKPEY